MRTGGRARRRLAREKDGVRAAVTFVTSRERGIQKGDVRSRLSLWRGNRLRAGALRRLRRGPWGRGRLCCDGGPRLCRLRLPWGRPRACKEFSAIARRGFLRAAFRCGRRDGREDC